MKKRTLKFNENGKFKILVITDLHERQANGNREILKKTEDSLLLTEAAVKALSPDLVVFNGDNALDFEQEDLQKTVKAITKPIRERNIPFTMVLGNHEHDKEQLPPKLTVKTFSAYDECLVREDKPELSGYANHYIALKGKSNKTKCLLFFIDSGATHSTLPEIGGYDWVHNDRLEWFEEVANNFREKNGGENVPSLVFQHMPVTEIYKLLKEVKGSEAAQGIKGHSIFSGKHYVLKENVKGFLGEAPCPPDYNNGEFDVWKKCGVKGAFFGHDHKNDFEGYVDGILLAQCKGSGFNGYTDGIKTGVKLITLDEKNISEIKTKDYYFSDFALSSKSAISPQKKINAEQKTNLKKIGVGTAALTLAAAATGLIVKKITKKNK